MSLVENDACALLIETIGHMLAIGVHTGHSHSFEGEIHGHVSVERPGSPAEVSEIWASPLQGAWDSHSRTLRDRRIFNPVDGLLLRSGRERQEFPAEPPRQYPLPEGVQFAFPLSLPIWGRPVRDTWKMSGAVRDGERIAITLRSMTEMSDDATLFVTEGGLPVALTTPDESIYLREWEPLGLHNDFWWRASGL